MQKEEFDKLHENLKEAVAALFRDIPEEVFPLILDVNGQPGQQNILHARLVKTPEGVVYVDEDEILDLQLEDED